MGRHEDILTPACDFLLNVTGKAGAELKGHRFLACDPWSDDPALRLQAQGHSFPDSQMGALRARLSKSAGTLRKLTSCTDTIMGGIGVDECPGRARFSESQHSWDPRSPEVVTLGLAGAPGEQARCRDSSELEETREHHQRVRNEVQDCHTQEDGAARAASVSKGLF